MNKKMKAQYDTEVERLVDKIKFKYRPDKIFVFGSYAKNKITLDSDVDFFIVKNTRKTRSERHREVSRLLLDRQIPVDILVFTPKEIEIRKEMGDFFILDILNEGRLIYARH